MRKEVLAPLIVLLMLAAVGGYMIMNNVVTVPNDTDNGDETDEGNNLNGDDWNVYYVQTNSDLPECNSATQGRLYYVASTSGFEACTFVGWTSVDLTGPDGEMGLPGTDGADGIDGTNGTNGVDGADGADGQDGEDTNMSYIASLEERIASLESELINSTSELSDRLNVSDSSVNWAYLDMAGMNFPDADLSYANLIGSRMGGAQLQNANLSHADLSNADLQYANLSGSYMYGATLTNVITDNTDLRYTNLSYADLSYAILGLTPLSYADLTNADLSYTTLMVSSLAYADLTNANLTGAVISSTWGMYLSDAIWDNTICPDGTNSDDNGDTCENNL